MQALQDEKETYFITVTGVAGKRFGNKGNRAPAKGLREGNSHTHSRVL